jgi:hypothetical protein
VERTPSGMIRFRRVLIRWDKTVRNSLVPLEIFGQLTGLLGCLGILWFHPLQALDDAVQLAPEELCGGGLTPFVCHSGWSGCCDAVT